MTPVQACWMVFGDGDPAEQAAGLSHGDRVRAFEEAFQAVEDFHDYSVQELHRALAWMGLLLEASNDDPARLHGDDPMRVYLRLHRLFLDHHDHGVCEKAQRLMHRLAPEV